MDLRKFFEELNKAIRSYAELKANRIRILASFLKFVLRLKMEYGATVECSRGSLFLFMTFSSKGGYDRYKKDLENGEIGKLILQLFLYPPFLTWFGLKVEDLVVYLNGELLAQETALHAFLTTNTSLAMDPQVLLQDVIRCHLCETPVPSKHCDICHIHLCEACVWDHLSDESKDHYIVPFKLRGKIPKCQKHDTKTCKELCETCKTPICSVCVVSDEHYQHETEDILKMFERKKELMIKDLQDLENLIYPEYQEAETDILLQRANVNKHLEILTSALNKQEETLHLEISIAAQRMQSEIDDMNNQLQVAIDKQGEEINHKMIKIRQIVQELKKLLDTSDVCLVSKYQSRNKEVRSLPAQLQITLPTFTPWEINREKIYQQVGSLSESSAKKHHTPYKTPAAMSLSPARSLMDEPRVLLDIQTEYRILQSVSRLSDSELWTCSYDDSIMRLYNLQRELLKSIQTKSGYWPLDIAVTRSGDLVYTDDSERSVNLVSDTQIQRLFTLRGWKPFRVCSTSSGDLLVIMDSDDRKQSKVVRYSGSTEKESIQWDDHGKPLYSSGDIKYLSENRNLDICLADYGARAVVVVSAAGELRFRYTGPPSATKTLFGPLGITTDSHSRILTTDINNRCIHILDHDGNFLRYIDNCGLQVPWGLCVDSRDNIFVVELLKGTLKKIQYCK